MKIFLALFFLLIMPTNNIIAAPLYDLATKSLESNIISLPQGEFLAAGGHQFKSLWTRDFCFSVPGLLVLKKYALVKNHLTYLISNRRKDGLIPIYADSMNPMKRVILGTINNALKTTAQYKISKNIKPYFSANGHFPTIDANILVLKASYEYYQATKDEEWWTNNLENFKEIFNYYQSFLQDGLISQGAFSDWQDSAKRPGKTFFMNLLYLDIATSYQFLSKDELSKLKNKIHQTFYDSTSGLYLSVAGSPYISLDGILWAIDKNLMPDTAQLYVNLKNHALWNQFTVPGYPTIPNYQKDWLAMQVKPVGLKNYHGDISWSWLMALSSIVAFKQNDLSESFRISSFLSELINRDQNVGEIYLSKSNSGNYPLFKTKLYASEIPFSWGAAFVLQMTEVQKTTP